MIQETRMPNNMMISKWSGFSASTAGQKHIKQGVPCQDYACAESEPRPFLVVADGRGSAGCSQVGARNACCLIQMLIEAEIGLMEILLDDPNHQRARALWPWVKDLIFKLLVHRQKGIAETAGVSADELEHTLLAVIIGSRRAAWIHVGDGAVVLEKHDGVFTCSEPEQGEFANVTCFVGQKTRPEQIRGRLHSVRGIKGFVAMSDGTAERFIHSRTLEPAPGMAQIFQLIREGQFGDSNLMEVLQDDFWEPEVQDDRSLAVLVKSMGSESV